MKKSDIKIFISYHKDSERIESEIMTPIHVGAKDSDLNLNILRDDEGINISGKNDKYCELTAQYWAWKNTEAEYYGFMHYRRHFIFTDCEYPFDDGRPVFYKKIDKRYRGEIGLDDEIIYEKIRKSDILLPLPADTSSWGAVSNEVQFSCLYNLHAADFDIVCKTVIELYPDYSEAVQEFRTCKSAYWYNIFIMKKEIFMHYSEWLFHILECAEKKIDFSIYDQQERRTLAFMAERLLSIYLIKLFKEKPELKVNFLKLTFVQDTDRITSENVKNLKDIKEEPPEMPYVFSVERAYKELNEISLPYEMESLFHQKKKDIEKLLHDKRIIFYGGGNWCKQFLSYFDRLGIQYPAEIWDREAKEDQVIRGIRVVKPDHLTAVDKTEALWVITIRNQAMSKEAWDFLQENGITEIVENRTLLDWLSYKLFLETAGRTDQFC